MLEWAKSHKLLLGGTAIVVIFVVLYSQSGSTATGTNDASTSSDLAAAESLQQAQLAANAQTSQNADALQANQEQIAGAVQLATIQAATQTNANQLSANIASQQLNVQEQLGVANDTLTQHVTDSNNATAVNLQNIQSSNQTAQLSDVINGLVAMSNNQTNAATEIAQIDKPQQSFFDKIF